MPVILFKRQCVDYISCLMLPFVLQAVQFLTETCRDFSKFYMAMCTANYRRCTNTKHCGVRSSWSSKKVRENYAWIACFCGQQDRLFIRFHHHVTWQLTDRDLEPLKLRPMVNRTWDSGIILGIGLANERRRYSIKASSIGWADI